jgi:hypothetical protein
MKANFSRGPALSAYLILVTLANFFGIFVNSLAYFGRAKFPEMAVADIPDWALLVFTVLSVAHILAILSIWNLSRTGVMLYIGVVLLEVPCRYGIGMPLSVFDASGVLVLLFLIRNKWPQMTWEFMPNELAQQTPSGAAE